MVVFSGMLSGVIGLISVRKVTVSKGMRLSMGIELRVFLLLYGVERGE